MRPKGASASSVTAYTFGTGNSVFSPSHLSPAASPENDRGFCENFNTSSRGPLPS